jgi:DNA-binding LytR/AlgR family response regulator
MVLLDINLDDKKNGIDLGILIDQTFRVPVIFITAYSDKSTFLEAARANPMGFIVKPFNDIDLDRTIILAMNNFRRQNEEKYGNVKMEIEKESVFVKDKGKIKQITVNEILWLDAMENYTIINTSKERFVVNSFLKDVIDKLGNKFIRIHRSHAVAIDKIKSIEDNSLFIGSGCLNISQTYRKDLMERINLL